MRHVLIPRRVYAGQLPKWPSDPRNQPERAPHRAGAPENEAEDS